MVLDAGHGAVAEQVHDQLLAHVGSGRLAPGDRLPTVRALAAELGISTATVAKAYRRLEEAGVTATATRAGTVVRDPGTAGAGAGTAGAGAGTAGAGAGDPGAGAAAEAMAAATRSAGLSDEAAHALLRRALARRPPRP